MQLWKWAAILLAVSWTGLGCEETESNAPVGGESPSAEALDQAFEEGVASVDITSDNDEAFAAGAACRYPGG